MGYIYIYKLEDQEVSGIFRYNLVENMWLKPKLFNPAILSFRTKTLVPLVVPLFQASPKVLFLYFCETVSSFFKSFLQTQNYDLLAQT